MKAYSCAHCQTCARRTDWEFLKGFFEREKAQTEQIDNLLLRHKDEILDLETQIDALSLQNTSTKAYLDDVQAQLDAVKDNCMHLQAANADLDGENVELRTRVEDLQSCYESSCIALTDQADDLKQKKEEMRAMEALLKRLKAMIVADNVPENATSEASSIDSTCSTIVERGEPHDLNDISCRATTAETRGALLIDQRRRSYIEQDTFSISVMTALPESKKDFLNFFDNYADRSLKGPDAVSEMSFLPFEIDEEDDSFGSISTFELVE